MIELIGIIACLAACIGVPLQVAKMRTGWMPKNFKGTAAEYAATFAKQLTILMWVGLGFGVLDLAMIAIPEQGAEWIAKLVGGVLWLALAGISFVYRGQLVNVAPPGVN